METRGKRNTSSLQCTTPAETHTHSESSEDEITIVKDDSSDDESFDLAKPQPKTSNRKRKPALKKAKISHTLRIPLDIILTVASYLPPKELFSLSWSSKTLHTVLSNQHKLWKECRLTHLHNRRMPPPEGITEMKYLWILSVEHCMRCFGGRGNKTIYWPIPLRSCWSCVKKVAKYSVGQDCALYLPMLQDRFCLRSEINQFRRDSIVHMKDRADWLKSLIVIKKDREADARLRDLEAHYEEEEKMADLQILLVDRKKLIEEMVALHPDWKNWVLSHIPKYNIDTSTHSSTQTYGDTEVTALERHIVRVYKNHEQKAKTGSLQSQIKVAAFDFLFQPQITLAGGLHYRRDRLKYMLQSLLHKSAFFTNPPHPIEKNLRLYSHDLLHNIILPNLLVDLSANHSLELAEIRDEIERVVFFAVSEKLRVQLGNLATHGLVHKLLFGNLLYHNEAAFMSLKHQLPHCKQPKVQEWDKLAYNFISQNIVELPIYFDPPYPKNKGSMYSSIDLELSIVPAIRAEILAKLPVEYLDTFNDIAKLMNDRKLKLFRQTLINLAPELSLFYFSSPDFVIRLRKTIFFTSMYQRPPLPRSRKNLVFSQSDMKQVIIPHLQDEISSTTQELDRFCHHTPSISKIKHQNEIMRIAVPFLMNHFVNDALLFALIEPAHPSLKCGLRILIEVFLRKSHAVCVEMVTRTHSFEQGVIPADMSKPAVKKALETRDADGMALDGRSSDESSEDGSYGDGYSGGESDYEERVLGRMQCEFHSTPIICLCQVCSVPTASDILIPKTYTGPTAEVLAVEESILSQIKSTNHHTKASLDQDFDFIKSLIENVIAFGVGDGIPDIIPAVNVDKYLSMILPSKCFVDVCLDATEWLQLLNARTPDASVLGGGGGEDEHQDFLARNEQDLKIAGQAVTYCSLTMSTRQFRMSYLYL